MNTPNRTEQLADLRRERSKLEATLLDARYQLREACKGRYEMLSQAYQALLEAPNRELQLIVFLGLRAEEAALEVDFKTRQIAALERIIEEEALDYV